MKKIALFMFIQLLVLSAGSLIFAQNDAQAVWPLDSKSMFSPLVTGALTAQNEDTLGYALGNPGYTGINNSQRGFASQSSGGTASLGSWPNENAPNPGRYLQFTLAAAAGVTSFEVDSVTMAVGNSGGSDNIRAAIFISTDEFATSVRLDSLAMPNKALVQLAYAPKISLPAGKKLAVRIYPWATNGGHTSGKYFNVQNLVIKGKTKGEATVFLPVVSTAPVTNLSTTSATSGGNITSDGGGKITSRGVCWNIKGSPTTADFKAQDTIAAGGAFISQLTGLTPGVKYYIRAYAVNSAGTAYGKEDSLTTLTALSAPVVTTSAITSILTTTASGGGVVTTEGGKPVTARGICWNTKGNPTTADSKTSDGTGPGSFTSGLTGLLPVTKYYVRAYAVNELGTSYGDTVSFTTAAPKPDVKITVAKDGSGDYKTVQEAFNAIPDNYTGTYTVFVKKGVYYEKLLLGANKINVVLQGEDRDNTILTYDDYSGRVVNGVTLGTSTSYSTAIDASDFKALNITFQNTSKDQGQAVALRTNGDRMIFKNCRMLGYQDTYYTWGQGRIFNVDCFIEGTVDFIFGRSIAYFDHCTINIKRNGGTLTAANTEQTSKFGYVFSNCTITSDSMGYDGKPITTFALGRPWGAYAKTVFMNCTEPANLDPAGWMVWDGRESTCYYAEYKCSGPGAAVTARVPWSKQLTDTEAKDYSIVNIFSKASGIGAADWWPVSLVGVKEKSNSGQPSEFRLNQNYPNPFNPSTVITYSLAERSMVELNVYDLLGRKAAELVNGTENAGVHSVTFDASKLSTGVYFYTLKAGKNIETRKMMVIR